MRVCVSIGLYHGTTVVLYGSLTTLATPAHLSADRFSCDWEKRPERPPSSSGARGGSALGMDTGMDVGGEAILKQEVC